MTDEKSVLDFLAILSESLVEEKTNRANRALKPEGERPCPICGVGMKSVHEKRILIDRCEAHGVWLDNGELQAIFENSRDSKLLADLKARDEAEKRAAEIRAARHGF